MIFIARELASSQSKGCLLFLQLGTSALVLRQLWGKPREAAWLHAEIDTPFERLRVTVGGRRFRLPVATPHGAYRDRWLRRLGYAIR